MIPRTIDLEDPRPDRGRTLAERYEQFAGTFVATRNPGQAFRMAFAPDKAMALSMVNAQAQRLLQDPKMQARMRELIDTAAQGTICNIRALLVDFHDIATADPNEIISHVIDCCRHCHGAGHAFQWADEGEFARACQDVMEHNGKLPANAPAHLRREMPDISGGFGYWPTNEPHPCCPRCFGRGIGHTVLHDTTKLSPAARKLYRGVKETKGGLEVLMHDQNAARELLLKVAGVMKEAMPLDPPAADAPGGQRDAIPAEASEVEAGRAYLRLIAGTDVTGKP